MAPYRSIICCLAVFTLLGKPVEVKGKPPVCISLAIHDSPANPIYLINDSGDSVRWRKMTTFAYRGSGMMIMMKYVVNLHGQGVKP